MMLGRYLAEKHGALGLSSFSQHPGVVDTKLGRDAPWFANLFFRLFGKSPEKGARNLLYLARANEIDLENGAYYKDKKSDKATEYSRDMQVARRLVNALETMAPASLLKGRRLFELS
jgi:hypothetical protein